MQDSSVQTIERVSQTIYDPDSYCLQASSASGPFTTAFGVFFEPATAMLSQRQSLALALLLSRGATSVCFSHGFRAATALASPPLSRSSLSRVGSSPAGAPLLNRLVSSIGTAIRKSLLRSICLCRPASLPIWCLRPHTTSRSHPGPPL